MLENTRFNAGETKNDEGYARELADGCDLYVNDAFGSAHRAHSSTEAVAHVLPAYAGLLLEDELRHLGRLLGDEVERPFVLVSGGAKVDDKIGVLQNLGSRADTVLIGGKMAEDVRDENPFPFEATLPTRRRRGRRVRRPTRSRASSPYDSLPDGWLGLDIGPETREALRERDPRGADGLLERPDGRLRVAAVRRGDRRRRARRRRRATGSPSSAAATPSARCRRPASPSACRGSRPAAARRSSCSRARELPGVAAIPPA